MGRNVTGLAALDAGQALERWSFARRDLRPDDVAVRVDYCGVCHTDLHAWHGEAPYGDAFPLVPGHEFVGTVVETGSAVSEFAVGDAVAVGNIVDSCGVCPECVAGREQNCAETPTLTYGGTDRVDGQPTYGGYSNEYVLTERFVYHLPANLDPAGAAPLMCAGVTVWEPLRRWMIGPGSKVGVVGLGGLGHLAVKFAVALGAEVDLFTTSMAKSDAARTLGATHVVNSTDESAMAAVRGRYDFILDTVAVTHDLTGYLQALSFGGTLCIVGALDEMALTPMALLGRSVAVAGGCGRPGTQEMLDFAGEHSLTADVEIMPAHAVGEALARLARNDVRFRFSLDMSGLHDDR